MKSKLTLIEKKHNMKFYKAFIHKDDCIKFYDTLKEFIPLQGRRIYSIDNGYTIQRYEVILKEEEAAFLILQLSAKSKFYDEEELDRQNSDIEIDDCM